MEYIDNADVLDLFAGTGNLGIEALSRGAKSAVFIDKSENCTTLINDNLLHTKLYDKSTIIRGDAFSTLQSFSKEGKKFNLIFLDPPYNKGLVQETLKLIDRNDILRPEGIIVAERDIDDSLPAQIGSLELVSDRKYGDTVLSLFKVRGHTSLE